MDPTAIDPTGAGLSGVLGALALAVGQALWARFFPATPKPPGSQPLPAPGPLPPDVQPVPAPPQMPAIRPIGQGGLPDLLRQVGGEVLAVELSGAEPTPAMRAAGKALRRWGDQLDPPVKP